MANFDINGYAYSSKKLDAMTQTDIAAGFASFLMVALTAGGDSNIRDLLVPLAKEAREMSKEDRHFIFSTCMGSVKRKGATDAGFAPIWNEAAKRPMFGDIDAAVMLKIVFEVLKDNFSNFFTVFQQG